MNPVKHLPISQPYIALFGSGNSIHDITAAEFETIKANAFVITLNYAPIHLNGHLNMWSDRKVSDFLKQHYARKPKACLLLAQEGRVTSPLKQKIDYWFDRKKENLQGNYTIVWALQLLQKYFPDKKILLFGVDMYSMDNHQAKWYDRYTEFDRKKRGPKYQATYKLNQCAKQIARFVSRSNVYNCNPDSQLSYFDKKNWKEMFRLRILHLCTSSLAGAPVHLSKLINKYTTGESKTILKRAFTSKGLRNLHWDYDLVGPSTSQLEAAVDWADIIHHHGKLYPGVGNEKPSLIQFHSPTKAYVPYRTHEKFNGRKLVIAQYHPRFYTDALIVPNLIDIWEEQFCPADKATSTINIFYSWASERKGGWSDKGSSSTTAILQKIKSKFGHRVSVDIMHNKPYATCMALKRKAHICIDECVTGSYHLQSLEGCSVGALTFNNIDELTLGFMSQVSGTKEHPFAKTKLKNLFEKLAYYIDHREALEEKGRQSRQWMEKYWDPKKLVFRFTNAYFNLLHHNTVTLNQIESRQATKKRAESYPTHSNLLKSSAKLITPAARERENWYKSPLLAETSSTKPGNSILDLHQKYSGQDIYIFGTGPSLFEVNPDDFKDEICFGINYSFEVMPHMNYIFVHVIETYDTVRKVIDNHKLVLPETLVRQFYRNRQKTPLPNRITASNPDAHIYPIQNPYEKNIRKKSVSLEQQADIFTWSTTTHSAIHLAAYAGAKNIYLIGADYKLYPNGRVHFDSQYSPIYGSQNWEALRKHRQGDEWLASELVKQGVHLQNLSAEASNLTKIVNKKLRTRLLYN